MLWRNNTYLRALQSAALRPFQVTEITTKTWRCNKYATGSPEGPSLRIWQRWLVLTTSMTGHSWGTPYGMAVKVLLEMINQERRFTPNMNTLLNELGSTESKEKKKSQARDSIHLFLLSGPPRCEALQPWTPEAMRATTSAQAWRTVPSNQRQWSCPRKSPLVTAMGK